MQVVWMFSGNIDVSKAGVCAVCAAKVLTFFARFMYATIFGVSVHATLAGLAFLDRSIDLGSLKGCYLDQCGSHKDHRGCPAVAFKCRAACGPFRLFKWEVYSSLVTVM